jgi:hypothetical protein
MPETMTFRFSWHYRWVILPIIWFCITTYWVSILVQYAGVLLSRQGISIWAVLIDLPIVLVFFFVWCKWFTMPFSIVIDESGMVTLRGILRKSEIAAGDILRIERWVMWERVFAQGKKFYISTLMENNAAIIPALKAHNPDIETSSRYHRPRGATN